MFKLSELAAAETTTVEIVNPHTKAPLEVFVTLHTPDSAKWDQLTKKYSNPDEKQAIIIGKKDEGNKIEIDPAQAESREKVLIAAVTEITGIEDLDNSPAAYKKMLGDPAHAWMLEQIAEHVSDRKNFLDVRKSD